MSQSGDGVGYLGIDGRWRRRVKNGKYFKEVFMKLKSMDLQNFKGIKLFKIEPNGLDLNIYGANQTGKTTIFDAFTWLLFGKDSLDRADFGIKTVGLSGVVHSVEATIILDDGSEHTLKKAYKELWSKPRGKTEREFTGHTTEHWVDGVPEPKKNLFDKFITEIVEESMFKLLTNPRHFNEVLEWKVRRELLMLMCGVSSESIKETEDRLKVIKEKRSAINKDLNEIPTRIDEADKALPIIPAGWVDTSVNLRAKVKLLSDKVVSLKSGGGLAEINKQIAEADAELVTVRSQLSGKIRQDLDAIEIESGKCASEYKLISDDIKNKESNILTINANINAIEKEQVELKKKYYDLEAIKYAGLNTCPVCKQDLPANMIEEAEANFNRDKSTKLEAINASGLENKAQLIRLDEKKETLANEIAKYTEKLTELNSKDEQLLEQVNSMKALLNQVEDTPEYQAVLEKKAKLEEHRNNYSQSEDSGIAEIEKEIEDLNAALKEQESIQLSIKQRESGLARIKELENRQKELAGEYEKLSKELSDTERTVRKNMADLEGQINDQFEYVNFKLFNELISGGIEDCCEAISKDGVKYKDMSNSQRIRAGLDIIRTFSQYQGITCPVFIDNRESTSHIPDMGEIQVISLIVNPEDKTLRVETVRKEVLV